MLGSESVYSWLVSQFTYQNFGRYYYNIRQCAAADLGTMTWLAMHCDSELDCICKIPRGTIAQDLLYFISCSTFSIHLWEASCCGSII